MALLKSSPLFLFTTLSIPAAGLLIHYIYSNYPLPASKSRTIKSTDSIPSSFKNSNTLTTIINPRNHDGMVDTRSIYLSKKVIGDVISDEELLARFLKGFFGGWIFYPEKNIITALSRFNITFGTAFSDIPSDGPLISAPLSRTNLPLKYTQLFAPGNFLVLAVRVKSRDASPLHGDSAIKSQEDVESLTGKASYIDVAFGDDRKTFAGCHRFEVLRQPSEKEEQEEGGVTIVYSHLSCNPTVKEATFPKLFFDFHKFYAMHLFRDGIREVLRA